MKFGGLILFFYFYTQTRFFHPGALFNRAVVFSFKVVEMDAELKKTRSQPISINSCFKLKPEVPFLKEPGGSLLWLDVLYDYLMRLTLLHSQLSWCCLVLRPATVPQAVMF